MSRLTENQSGALVTSCFYQKHMSRLAKSQDKVHVTRWYRHKHVKASRQPRQSMSPASNTKRMASLTENLDRVYVTRLYHHSQGQGQTSSHAAQPTTAGNSNLEVHRICYKINIILLLWELQLTKTFKCLVQEIRH